MLIATQLKDPSVTDGMTLPDRQPMRAPELEEKVEDKPMLVNPRHPAANAS